MIPTLILGSQFTDDRGALNFFNAFDMKEVVRFYEISPISTDVIRAWQGHQKETKWFYCHLGSFLVHLIPVDDFESPSTSLFSDVFVLQARKPAILRIPGGYANGFKALESSSKLQVFSNLDLKKSKKDDFRFPINQWKVDWDSQQATTP